MAFVTRDGVRLHYRLEGSPDKPAIVFAHCLGLDLGLWDAQVADLLPYFQVLRYDSRGHGASDAPPGDYTLDDLGRDALAVVDAAGLKTFAWCGLSLGGMVGQWLGVHAAERLTHLVLANTTAKLTEPQGMETRRVTVLRDGMAAVVDIALARCCSPERIAAREPRVEWARHTIATTSAVGYAGCCAVLRDLDTRALLPRITAPTLVIAGDRDVSMPWDAHAAPLAAAIPGARLVRLPSAHVSNLERPRSFSAALFGFLRPWQMASLEDGARARRATLGDAHVDRAQATATPFTATFQELITRYAWGTIWTRPGLDARTRRLLVLAITASLGRWEEFSLHVRAGLEHELEPCDLEEALLQLAAYAGIPAANEAFKRASALLEDGT